MWKTAVFCVCLLCHMPGLRGQATYTAGRSASVQVGVAASTYTLDYGEGHESGFTVYGDVDFTKHLGVEALYRNASIVTPHDTGENHLLVGPRLRKTYGPFTPYGKLLLGSGTINFQQGYNLTAYSETYFIYAIGGGVDLHARHHLNIRLIDFEYQFWPGFPPHGLTPYGASAGAAYVF